LKRNKKKLLLKNLLQIRKREKLQRRKRPKIKL